jgi:dTDP-D-glucose 4,6-dehydratase
MILVNGGADFIDINFVKYIHNNENSKVLL